MQSVAVLCSVNETQGNVRFCLQQQGEEASLLLQPGGRQGKDGGVQVKEQLPACRLPQQAAHGVPVLRAEGCQLLYCRIVEGGGLSRQPVRFLLRVERLVRPFRLRMPIFQVMQQVVYPGGGSPLKVWLHPCTVQRRQGCQQGFP